MYSVEFVTKGTIPCTTTKSMILQEITKSLRNAVQSSLIGNVGKGKRPGLSVVVENVAGSWKPRVN